MMIAAVPLLYSQAAFADARAGAGAFLGYSFANSSFEWGVEGYRLEHDPCANCGKETVFGPVVRLTFRSWQPHLSLTAMVGTDVSGESDSTSMGIEAGASLSLTGKKSLDFTTGAYLENLGFAVYARQNWKAQHTPVGITLRIPTTNSSFIGGQVSDGRPFRDASGKSQRAITPETGDTTALGAHWAARALDECASVPAFMQLAEELLDLGAPNELVERALNAAADELRHTRMTTTLARRYGALHTAPTPPVYSRRPALERSQQLARLAQESWHDGCLGEGAAAAIAGAEASTTNDPALRRTQKIIQKDETGHASLSQDVLRWVISQDSKLAAAVRRERLQTLGMSSMTLTSDEVSSVLRHSHAKARDFLSQL